MNSNLSTSILFNANPFILCSPFTTTTTTTSFLVFWFPNLFLCSCFGINAVRGISFKNHVNMIFLYSISSFLFYCNQSCAWFSQSYRFLYQYQCKKVRIRKNQQRIETFLSTCSVRQSTAVLCVLLCDVCYTFVLLTKLNIEQLR